MEDMSLDDPASQYMPLGSVFIAIAIAVWTSVAVWLCYSGPPGNEAGDAEGDGQAADGSGDLPDGMICRVARGFAELLLEGKDKASTGTQCDTRSLDLSKLEELLTPSKSDCKGGVAKKSSKGLLGKVGSSVPGKDGNGHLNPGLAGLSLGRDGEKETGVLCESRSVTSPPGRASGDIEGRVSRTSASVGVGDDDVNSDKPDFTGFREQLRDKLSASLSSSGRKYGAMDDLGPVASPARSRVDMSEAEAGADRMGDRRGGVANAKREALEDFLKQLLHPPGPGLRGDEKLISNNSSNAVRARGKLPEGGEGDEKEVGTRPATMLSMAEHAREIGNKYLQDRHFAGAAHCYEVACLLYPAEVGGSALSSTIAGTSLGSNGGAASGGSPGQLAAYHCNCALACLELGRYGDAINEGNAALVLTPPKHLAVKALYRLAVAYVNLKNAFEARRCLKKCLELDPMNEYVRAFLGRLGDEEAVHSGPEGHLTWIEPPKRVQCLGVVAREKAKGKKAKQKANGTSADEPTGGCTTGSASSVSGCSGGAGGKDVGSTVRPPEVRLDREAGLWHTMTRHNNKLYILGGWSDGVSAPGALGASYSSTAGKGDTNNNNGHTNGNGTGVAMESPVAHGSDELHVFDVDTFELRQLSGPNSKPPHPCYCHTATMVNSIMVVFGGCGPPADQPALVMIFDVQQAKWRVPQTAGIPPRQRQGHTANAVQGDRHLCIFGGIEPTGEHRVARVYNDAHLLDLQSFSWRKLEVGGHRPPARFGHTATNLPGNSAKLLILGGRDHLGDSTGTAVSGGFTGLHILDTERRTWTQQAFSGTPPTQAFYHAASVIDDQTILYLTSGATSGATNGVSGAVCAGAAGQLPLHVLDLEAWHWSTPRSCGLGPAPHIGHTAALVGSRVYMFGGVVMREGHPSADKAVYVLDASQLRREQPPERDTPQAAERSTNHVNNNNTAQATRNERAKGERAKSDTKAAAAAAAAAAVSSSVVLAAPATAPPAVEECTETSRVTASIARSPGQAATSSKPSAAEDNSTPRPAVPSELPAPVSSAAPPSGAGAAAPATPATPAAPQRSDGTPVSRAAMRAAARAEATRAANAAGEKNNNHHGPEDRIQMMLRENDFDENLDDATELSFEELLEQEKAYFKAQSEKPSFPRAKDHSSGKKGHKF